MTHTIGTDRDLDSLLHAIVANPGDEVTRFTLADYWETAGPSPFLSCMGARPDLLRVPGRWNVDWIGSHGRYWLAWCMDVGGNAIFGLLRRKHAPRCLLCRAYQPVAGPAIGWLWRCGDCLKRRINTARLERLLQAGTSCVCGGTGHDSAGRWCPYCQPAVARSPSS